MCKVFSTKAHKLLRLTPFTLTKLQKKNYTIPILRYFFVFISRIIHYLFFVCTTIRVYYWLCLSLISRVLREIRVQFAGFFRNREHYGVSLLVGD